MVLRRGLAHGLVTLVLPLALLVGCGNGDNNGGSDGDGSGRGKAADPQSAQLAYAKCMRENGVDIPDPKGADEGGQVHLNPGAGGFAGADKEVFEKAQKACQKFAEDMGGIGPGGLSEQDKEKMVEVARCMRKHGVDMPDPDFDASDGQMGVEFPADDADFEAARKACKMEAP